MLFDGTSAKAILFCYRENWSAYPGPVNISLMNTYAYDFTDGAQVADRVSGNGDFDTFSFQSIHGSWKCNITIKKTGKFRLIDTQAGTDTTTTYTAGQTLSFTLTTDRKGITFVSL